MQKRNLLVVLTITLLFAVSACEDATPEPTATPAPTDTSIPTETSTPRPTNTPTVTPTATPIPLSQVNLDPLLVKSGDLPAGLSEAQVRSSPPGRWFREIPEPDNSIYRGFARDGDNGGGVTLVLYESEADVYSAYATIVGTFGDLATREQVAGVGEKAETASVALALVGGQDFISLAFVRCHAVVDIMMIGTTDLLDIKSYAERLDERLASVACR